MKKEILKIKIGKRIRKDIGELDSLKNSIKEIGLLHPIVIDENDNLIAGLRRLKAHEELGFEEISVNIVNIKDLIKGQCDENVLRKNFTPSEAVAVWEALGRPKGGRGKTRSDSEQVIKRATKLTGLSTDTLSKAKQVVEFGNPTLIQKMDKEAKVNPAYKEFKRAEAKRNRGKESKKISLPPEVSLFHGEFEKEMKGLKPNSIDLILTDPPYGKEFLSLWKILSSEGERVLKPGGYLITYSGQVFLPRVLQDLSSYLEYLWCIALIHEGKGRIVKEIVNKWKPILVFFKPPLYEIPFQDLITGVKGKKEEHKQAQSVKEAEQLIKIFSEPSATILDPFAGSGTNLIAGRKLKRRVIGIEKNIRFIKLIKESLILKK